MHMQRNNPKIEKLGQRPKNHCHTAKTLSPTTGKLDSSMRTLSTRTIQVITAAFLLGSPLARAGQPEPAITPGSEASARKYYSDISKILKGLNPTPAVTTLDNLLEFVG